MAKFHVSLTLNAQGIGNTYAQANVAAAKRLVDGAEKVIKGERPLDPGTILDDRDPGGGGPCRPQAYDVEVILVDQSLLPEARSHDDD